MGKPLPDVLGRDLRVLFCGINPSLVSAELGHHYARPGNRFWPALHLGGFTPRLLSAAEDVTVPQYGIGLTNLVDRPTRAADELNPDELRAGAAALEELVRRAKPALLCVVGLGAWRGGFGRPRAAIGLQPDTVAERPVWVVPNPSGLNAHYQLPQLGSLFGEVRAWADLHPPSGR